MKSISLITLLLLLIVPSTLSAITAEEIINRMDAAETFSTSFSRGEILTTDRFGQKTSTFNAWTRGAYESLIEFTSVAEKGQKVLRTKGELYLFYPDAQELIRLQGAALRQSLLGSDISYEDMTGEKNTLSQYKATLEGQESMGGRTCHILTLVAKSRTVAYPVQKIWVDTETFMIWKAQYSTQNGRLLKEMEVLETIEVEGRMFPSRTAVSDKLKKDSKTIMVLTEMQIDPLLDPVIFSLQNLTW
jgi:outer membrane lipoprotein-sorting protein